MAEKKSAKPAAEAWTVTGQGKAFCGPNNHLHITIKNDTTDNQCDCKLNSQADPGIVELGTGQHFYVCFENKHPNPHAYADVSLVYPQDQDRVGHVTYRAKGSVGVFRIPSGRRLNVRGFVFCPKEGQGQGKVHSKFSVLSINTIRRLEEQGQATGLDISDERLGLMEISVDFVELAERGAALKRIETFMIPDHRERAPMEGEFKGVTAGIVSDLDKGSRQRFNLARRAVEKVISSTKFSLRLVTVRPGPTPGGIGSRVVKRGSEAAEAAAKSKKPRKSKEC